MSMTHYMELLMENSPYNLLVFMALPVILAETVAITELVLLFAKKPWCGVRQINQYASVLVGMVFLVILAWLIPNVIYPLTVNGQWRGWIDVVAVIFFAIAGLPMIMLALLRLGWILKLKDVRKVTAMQIALVSSFLVFSHVAMIAGMADPNLFTASPVSVEHSMHEHESAMFPDMSEFPDMTEHHHDPQGHEMHDHMHHQ